MERPPKHSEKDPELPEAAGLEIEILEVLHTIKWKTGLEIANDIGERRKERNPNSLVHRIFGFAPRTTVYPVLTQMVEKGMIEARYETKDEQKNPNAPTRRLFRLKSHMPRYANAPAKTSRVSDFPGEPEPA